MLSVENQIMGVIVHLELLLRRTLLVFSSDLSSILEERAEIDMEEFQ